MINHNSFYRSLAKKGDTITLSSNDQPSIGEVGSASGVHSQNWEHFARRGNSPCSRALEYLKAPKIRVQIAILGCNPPLPAGKNPVHWVHKMKSLFLNPE